MMLSTREFVTGCSGSEGCVNVLGRAPRSWVFGEFSKLKFRMGRQAIFTRSGFVASRHDRYHNE